MKDLIFFKVHQLKEKRKLRRSTLKELKKLDSRKLKIKRELQLRFKERELRFSERCTKLERMLKLRVKRGISSRIMPTLDQLSMLQLLEMVFHQIRRLINMKFNLRLYLLIRVYKNLAELCQIESLKIELVLIGLSSNSRRILPERRQLIWLLSKRLKLQLMLLLSNKRLKT